MYQIHIFKVATLKLIIVIKNRTVTFTITCHPSDVQIAIGLFGGSKGESFHYAHLITQTIM